MQAADGLERSSSILLSFLPPFVPSIGKARQLDSSARQAKNTENTSLATVRRRLRSRTVENRSEQAGTAVDGSATRLGSPGVGTKVQEAEWMDTEYSVDSTAECTNVDAAAALRTATGGLELEWRNNSEELVFGPALTTRSQGAGQLSPGEAIKAQYYYSTTL